MWLVELAAAVYLGSVLWPYAKRLRRPTLPPWVHDAAIAVFVLIMLLAGFTALFRVR